MIKKNIPKDCDLYKQSYEEVVKLYEDKAFMYLASIGKISCCGGNHPRFGRHKKLFIRTACDMYAEDMENQKRRKSDKFK